IFLLDFNCSFLFIHNYTTHSYNLSPYIPMPEGRGITAMDGKDRTGRWIAKRLLNFLALFCAACYPGVTLSQKHRHSF
ncbi:hypothetical protein, partial [Methylacidiphilum sp. Yel]|uniref:hypothetical protein n=1 Tax=Methylacidiphilum sp. Yel TaxID=1847730 RepID=UPI00141AAD64